MWKRKFGFSILVLLLYLGGIYLLLKTQKHIDSNVFSSSIFEKISDGNKTVVNQQDTSIGLLSIPKIHLEKKLYRIGDKENTIEKNVTILKESTYPNVENSKLYLAAHSGTSKVSFFEDLDLLQIGDTFDITFDGKKYTYQINQIDSQKKTGIIKIKNTLGKQAILTTCHPKEKDQQFILIANIKKEQS